MQLRESPKEFVIFTDILNLSKMVFKQHTQQEYQIYFHWYLLNLPNIRKLM